jgi:iron complex outermembrane recepter protein
VRVPIFQDYEQELHSAGFHATMSWDLLDDYTLDGGIRFNLEEKTFDLTVRNLGRTGGGDDEEFWSAPTGSLGLTYAVNAETSVYAKYTRGWKPGHFNASVLQLGQDSGGDFAAEITVADPETIDSVELGAKTSWFDGRLGARAALFYYRYSDYQVFLLANEPGSAPQFEVINANDAEVYGAELDLDFEPVDGLEFNLRSGWLESQFLDFTDLRSQRVTLAGGTVFVRSVVVDFTGNSLPNSPRFKVSGTAQYAIDLGSLGTLTPRYDFSWTDKVYFDPSEGRGVRALTIRQVPLSSSAIAQRAYIIHNARISYTPVGGHLELALWVRNFTDEAYKTYVGDASVGFSSLLNYVGDPRTFGGSLSVSF